MVKLASFWKPEAHSQTVLPDMSILIGQKLMVNAKSQKSKWDILNNFQPMCVIHKWRLSLCHKLKWNVKAFHNVPFAHRFLVLDHTFSKLCKELYAYKYVTVCPKDDDGKKYCSSVIYQIILDFFKSSCLKKMRHLCAKCNYYCSPS